MKFPAPYQPFTFQTDTLFCRWLVGNRLKSMHKRMNRRVASLKAIAHNAWRNVTLRKRRIGDRAELPVSCLSLQTTCKPRNALKFKSPIKWIIIGKRSESTRRCYPPHILTAIPVVFDLGPRDLFLEECSQQTITIFGRGYRCFTSG